MSEILDLSKQHHGVPNALQLLGFKSIANAWSNGMQFLTIERAIGLTIQAGVQN